MINSGLILLEEISRKEQVLLNLLISLSAGSWANRPHLGAVMSWGILGKEAAPRPGASISSADLACEARLLFPARVRPGVCGRRGAPTDGRLKPSAGELAF